MYVSTIWKAVDRGEDVVLVARLILIKCVGIVTLVAEGVCSR